MIAKETGFHPMATVEGTVYVHSVAEAYLYLMTLRCPRCGGGPVQQSGELTKTGESTGAWAIGARCGACKHLGKLQFEIQPAPTRDSAESDQINPTAERSRAIDLLGWLSLFQSILTASQNATDRLAARQLAYEAAQCLDEAMKFYESDNEMPTADAFFSEESRGRFREHPEQFARSKWRQRRLMLPDSTVKTTGAAASGGRWWQFWRGKR